MLSVNILLNIHVVNIGGPNGSGSSLIRFRASSPRKGNTDVLASFATGVVATGGVAAMGRHPDSYKQATGSPGAGQPPVKKKPPPRAAPTAKRAFFS